jgi:hypothetical protein
MQYPNEDSGVVPWKPPVAMQLAEIEDKRLTCGQVSTAELKRRCPEAFQPDYLPLFLQLIEAQQSAALNRKLSRLSVNDREFAMLCRYDALAHERSAEIIERKLAKALKRLGYDGIDGQMMKLARQDFREMPRSLGNYIIDNSPRVRELLR